MRSEFHRTALTTIVTVIISISIASTAAASGPATGRDPFRPPSSPICTPGEEPPQTWRLRGIIGRDADYLAWLVDANGKWQPRRPAALLDAHWRLLKVEARSITVEALQGCGLLRKITLQGNRYDQDDLSADAARSQTALRHHGAAVADVR